MYIIDNDLLSIQEARILVENASEAREAMVDYSQEKLDEIVDAMFDAISAGDHIKDLAVMCCEETGYGNVEDKIAKNYFVCTTVRNKLRGMKCVGILDENQSEAVIKVGVPLGVIAALIPSTNPVATTIFQAIIAVKAGDAIVFSPHPRAQKSVSQTLDILIEAAEKAGLPKGAVSYMHTIAEAGTNTLLNHPKVNLILDTGVPSFLDEAQKSGKPLIYGGSGNGPAFIERTADIPKAVHDIIESKTFDYGMVSAAEQSVVVERCIEPEVRTELQRQGAYFMTQEETDRLGGMIYRGDGTPNPEFVGISARRIADRAGIRAPQDVKVLVAPEIYALEDDPYVKQKFCPVLCYYVEDDWKDACEKCIELLLDRKDGHTLVIHSRDEYVIRQFALKKPVARVLVNTPASLGGMGVTTDLFPSLTLGSGVTGKGFTSDNVSPMNLVYIRTVGVGIRGSEGIRQHGYDWKPEDKKESANSVNTKGLLVLQQLLDKALEKK